MQAGVYEIRSVVDGRRYVGSSVNMARRWKEHRLRLDSGKHGNLHLQRAWKKYGSEKFEFSVLVGCHADSVLLYEQMYLDALSPEFNLCRVAGSCLGVKRRRESIEAMRQKRIGLRWTASTKRKISESLSGRKAPTVNDATRQKQSIARKARGLGNLESLWAAKRGVPRTEEVRQKLSKAFAKFTEKQVIEIRALCRSHKQKEVAAMYGVGQSSVSEIVRGASYGWVI